MKCSLGKSLNRCKLMTSTFVDFIGFFMSYEDMLVKPMISANVEIIRLFCLKAEQDSANPTMRQRMRGGQMECCGFS